MLAAMWNQTFMAALRRRPPPPPAPDRLLWRHLRARRVTGLTFRRDVAMGPFLADFYCPEALLAVEIAQPGEGRAAAARATAIETRGIRIARLAPDDILADPARAAAGIVRMAQGRL